MINVGVGIRVGAYGHTPLRQDLSTGSLLTRTGMRAVGWAARDDLVDFGTKPPIFMANGFLLGYGADRLFTC
jgi:hypothetical protein